MEKLKNPTAGEIEKARDKISDGWPCRALLLGTDCAPQPGVMWVMGPGLALMSRVGSKAISPLAVTLFALVFGALLWSCLTYWVLVRRSHSRGD